MQMLWKILPQTVFRAAGAGQRKPVVLEERAVLQRTVQFISRMERLYNLTAFLLRSTLGCLCKAGSSMAGGTLGPCTPWRRWGGQALLPWPAGWGINCSKVVHSTIKTSWRLVVVSLILWLVAGAGVTDALALVPRLRGSCPCSGGTFGQRFVPGCRGLWPPGP